MEILHTAIAILAVVLLIIGCGSTPSSPWSSARLPGARSRDRVREHRQIAEGFGDIMAEVGLLIGFGVLIGALLYAMGALQQLVELLLRAFGPRRLPYALSAALTRSSRRSTSTYSSCSRLPWPGPPPRQLGRNGLPMLSGALTAGILVGYVFVVPGLGTVSIAGLLDVPLGTMLIYGLLIGPATAVITTLIFGRLLKLGFWNPDKDETDLESLQEAEEAVAHEPRPNRGPGGGDGAGHGRTRRCSSSRRRCTSRSCPSSCRWC